ncbi:MAG: hypothetical protein WCY98_04565 [Castellaniella sp.]
MTLLRLLSRHRQWYRRYRDRGVSGIEAAILLPLGVFMIFGFIELYQYHRASALVDRLSFTIANGVAMQADLHDRGRCTNADDICVYGAIAPTLFQPLDYNSNGKIIISAYGTTTPSRNQPVAWKGTPEWQKAFRGSSPGNAAVSSRLSNKAAFPPPRVGDVLVIAEVFYDYEPFVISARFWSALGGKRVLYSRFFFRPRFSDLRVLQ